MELDLKILSKEINELLWCEHKTLSTAESCTAGRISSVITAVPGSSNYFKGGLVCYADEIKSKLLGVVPEVIIEKTPVCEEVVKQMVLGANKLFGTDYAVAISGYAGPGGSEDAALPVKVGTIWIAVGQEGDLVTLKLQDDNGRDKNLAAATSAALRLLRDYLKEHHTEDTPYD